jgi:hypothetical protein
MLPGGQASWVAYVEARSSFVAGNFAATILLSQSLIENLLGGHLIIDDVGREVRQGGPRVGKPPRKRPHLRELIDHAIEAGVIALDDVDGIQRIMDMRNPLVHFRNINDSQNLTRRAMETGIHPDDLLFDDARSAISMTIRLIGNSQRALDRFR